MRPGIPAALRQNLLGSRGFYRRVAAVVLPMILQNTLTNVVALLDNVMVGQVGTLPMSAVAIVNQLLFVYNLCVFGCLSGAGIFGAQFYGQGDLEGVRRTFRFKLIAGLALALGAMALLGLAGPRLVGLYIAADTPPGPAQQTMRYAAGYLRVMLAGLLPFALTQVYAGTLRQCGHTTLPMAASITAMCVNFIGNALLIFGLCGLPRLGVTGAAVATVLSRLVELAMVAACSHANAKKYPYMRGAYRPFSLPGALAWQIFIKSWPLLLNECLWSLGQAVLLQCYSMRGIQVVAAMNICNTVSGVFITVALSFGDATAILVGQALGAGEKARARRTAWRMLALAVSVCVALGLALALCAPFVPRLYNAEEDIRRLAARCLLVTAAWMPLMGFANNAYFTLRSGGKTLITFLFDSCFSWLVSVPAAFVLVRATALDVVAVYLAVCALDTVKCVLGYAFIKKGAWANNLVG